MTLEFLGFFSKACSFLWVRGPGLVTVGAAQIARICRVPEYFLGWEDVNTIGKLNFYGVTVMTYYGIRVTANVRFVSWRGAKVD